MKLRNFLSMGVLSVLALGACAPDADDNSEWNDGTQAVSFTSRIQGVNSRAANNAWDANDKIGVFVKKGGVFDAVNKHYSVSETGTLSAATTDDAIYYPGDGSKVDFIAYYPYSSTLINNAYAIDLANQTSQPAIDLLYSMNAAQKDKTVTTPVQLTFKHQLTKIVLNITKDATIPTLAGLQVGILGTKTRGSFKLLDGALTPDDASMQDISAKMNGAGTLAEAIVLPVNGLNGGKISFVLNGKTKAWDIPAGQIYAAGSMHTYPVTLKETGGQISVSFGTATITDWTPVSGGNIDIDFGDSAVVPDPDPTPGVEKVFFTENLMKSGAPLASNISIATFTDWSNPTCTFVGAGGEDIRSIAYKTDPAQTGTIAKVNNLWLKASAASSLAIGNIDAMGYKNIKVVFEAAANVYNSGVSADLNTIKVSWNGTAVTVPSKIVTQANKEANVFYEMTVATSLEGISSSTLVFSADAEDNKVGFRVTNIKLFGTK